jgi:putative transcriptional regulator
MAKRKPAGAGELGSPELKGAELKGKARLRSEIVDMARALNKVGAVSDVELEKTTLTMLGRDALPKVKPLTPAEIAKVRERAGVSQAVFAGFLNVVVSTVSQWERGERRPTGTALKLLQVVRVKGLEVLK